MSIKGVTKRGENTYRFTVSMGFDENGKHIRRTMTYKLPEGTAPTKAEKMIQRAYNDFEDLCKEPPKVEKGITFKELVDIYMREFAPNELKPVTMYNYEGDLRIHLLPVFGDRECVGIENKELTTFFTGLDLSPETTRKLKTVLSSVFSYGVKQKYINENPCVNANHKKDPNKKKKVKYLNGEQCKKLMELTAEYSAFNTLIRFLLLTGLRIGEALALTWSQIDFVDEVVNVSDTLAFAYGEKYMSSPKTENSIRTIKLGSYGVSLLKNHKEQQENEQQRVGMSEECRQLVFPSPLGKYGDRGGINKELKKLLSENGMPSLSVHALRHSNASLMINAGVDIKMVSENLGHCGIGVTGDIYSHMFKAYKAKTAKALEDFLL